MKHTINSKLEKSKYVKQSKDFHSAFSDSLLLMLIGIALSFICLNRIFYRKQLLKSEGHVLKKSDALMPAENTSSERNRQSKIVESFKHDLASSGVAQNAQFALFITLSGTIIGAFLVGLPKDFALNLWSWDMFDQDLRVLATYLMAIDLYIKYCWGMLVVRWPFSLSHNIVYSLVCATMLGFALSMANLNAWLVWGAATCFAYSAAYMQNLYAVHKYKREREKDSHEQIISEARPHTPDELARLRKSSIGLALYVLIPGICALYGALDNYRVLPTWLQLRVSLPLGIGWGLPITLIVMVEILIWGLAVMPKERYR
ncbi:MAG TPA: hypothetical protein VKR06_32835 [Ktedonosporobacter sp.]|nr:hypothetical protein [Ktedonosporobacter sp.]